MQKLNFIIAHGTMGSSKSNWFPWLKEKLESNGHTVISPDYPTPEGQTYEKWHSIFLEKTKGLQLSRTILIGHSIGAPFALRIAEETSAQYKAIILVCPFDKTLGIEGLDELNASFVEHPFNWALIQDGAKKFVCFAGDNDPYVTLAFSKVVADKLNTKIEIIPNGGHLNAESGYTEFHELLNEVNSL